MKKFAAYIILPVFFILASCSDKEPTIPTYPTDPSTKQTVLLYLGIDNNFKTEKNKIETLRSNWNKEYDANLFVYVDGGDQTAIVHIHHDQYGENIVDTVRLKGRENSADPEVFGEVLKYVYDGWTAKQNGLIVLSHGSGWLKSGKLHRPDSRSIVNDEGDGSDLELWDFAENIPLKLDYIILDDCLMAGIEVMSELYGKAKHVVACPAEIIVDYIRYERMMLYLTGGTEPDLRGVVDYTYDYATSTQYPYLTMSVVDIDKIPLLESVCRDAFYGVDMLDINVGQLQQFYPVYPLYTDLGHVIESVRPDIYAAFVEALRECVVYSVYTSKYYSGVTKGTYAIDNFSGLTMYVPQARFPGLNEDYKILKWYKAVFE